MSKGTAVTKLTVLQGDQPLPEGWVRIDKDLNAGAKGEYLYFACEYDGRSAPLTDVLFLIGHEALPPDGYYRIGVDLNKGTFGWPLYACYTRLPSRGSRISDLDVLLSDVSFAQPSRPWERIDLDLNRKASGKFVYLVYQQPDR